MDNKTDSSGWTDVDSDSHGGFPFCWPENSQLWIGGFQVYI